MHRFIFTNACDDKGDIFDNLDISTVQNTCKQVKPPNGQLGPYGENYGKYLKPGKNLSLKSR